MNRDIEDGREEANIRNSTRSCPGSFSSSSTASNNNRAQFPRRSLKNLRIMVGKNLQPYVQSDRTGCLEEIREGKEFDDASTSKTNEVEEEEARNSISRGSIRSISVRLEENIHKNYYTIAYSVVIIAYLIGFAEYLYLRLVSLLIPDHTYHHPSCEGKASRRIGKDGFHYGVSLAAFIVIALFQLICFFGLTISENWTICNLPESDDEAIKKKHAIAAHVRKLLGKTIYRLFTCYGICSAINCGIIFYMVGIQDSLGDTVSTIFLYMFDAIIILYFIAFPLTTIIYHPQVQCFRREPTIHQLAPNLVPAVPIRSQSSTLESTVGGLEEYAHSPRRPHRTTTVV
ncbi:unnamed protein product [Auanema sp. JU1783]|nr:unnamed protein product [Auanema sp. JU1783]